MDVFEEGAGVGCVGQQFDAGGFVGYEHADAVGVVGDQVEAGDRAGAGAEDECRGIWGY
ncbi:hypothetical protein [Kribbella sp. NPDC051620]|uniref:hypothetical protein n=1 Tax=Kribbella sp. NPDC051620 TaxID=3364120 RepID=UPI0037A2A8B6